MIKIKLLQAGNGDSFLITYNDQGGRIRNILVDGGTELCYYDRTAGTFGQLKEEIDIIRNKEQKIDLLILTHIDNDHICGLLQWFEHDEKAASLVSQVWFNSGKLVARYLKKKHNKDLNVSLKKFTSTFTGVHEAVAFEEHLLENELWDWKRKPVMAGDEYEQYGAKLTVLSPGRPQLEKLIREYRAKSDDPAYTGSGKKDWDHNLSYFIKEEAKKSFRFTQDNSPKNGSSIAFILVIQKKNFLFLADAHPRLIAAELVKQGYSKDEPLEAAFMKLSHHGSKKNTDKKLLELVATKNYLISTDSTQHNHPDKRTIARVINHNPSAVLHFNYKRVANDIVNDTDWEEFLHFKIKLTKEFKYR